MGPNHNLLRARTGNRTGNGPPPRALRRHGGALLRRRRHLGRAGRRSSAGYARFGAMTSAAHMAFDELTLESFKWENTLCAADAVAQNLPYPPECLPVRDMKPLARSKCRRRRRRGTPPRHDADCGSQWRYLRLRACAPPRVLGAVDIWRIDGLLTRKHTAMGVFRVIGFQGCPTPDCLRPDMSLVN